MDYLPTCPECGDALTFVRDSDARDIEASGNQIVGPFEFRVFSCSKHGQWRLDDMTGLIVGRAGTRSRRAGGGNIPAAAPVARGRRRARTRQRDERDERDDEDEEDYGQRGHHGTDRSPRSCSALMMISGPRVSLVKTPVPAIGRPDCLDRVRGKATQGMLWRHRATRIGRTATGVLDAVNHSSIQSLWMPRSRRARCGWHANVRP